METTVLAQPNTAAEIVATLPAPDYLMHRQPEYSDQADLVAAVSELQSMEGVTTLQEIDSLQAEFTEIADGERDDLLVIMGRCSQPVRLETDTDLLVGQRLQSLDICRRGLGNAIKFRVLRRECSEKPRSAATQILDNQEVAPHMGDAINGEELVARTPDPSRMVAAAIQGRDIHAGLIAAGETIPAAKEALLLPSLQAMMRVDQKGNKYYVGAELPWIGERTRQPEGAHVEALSGIKNPVGIKLGPSTTAEEVQSYQEKLNPDGVHGKLVFMLRMGLDHAEALRETLSTISEHAPHAIIMYDIHGSTTTGEQGHKIRSVSRIVQEIHLTASVCRDAGMKLHGIHIETTTETSDDGKGRERLECIDFDEQIPTDRPGVDPQLNTRQASYVIGATAGALALAV